MASRATQNLFLIATVPVVSFSATFLLLYLFMPRYDSSIVSTAKIVNTTHETTTPNVAMLPPVQLKVDVLAINAAVNPKGLTAGGDMDIDEDPNQLAWYNLGPKPGEEGSAVIAGHYGWKDTVPSIFNNLNKLIAGDEITTLSEDGSKKTFVVTRTALYAPNQDATDIFKSDDGKAHLNLITCQGTWVNTDRSYSERLVVFTDFVK